MKRLLLRALVLPGLLTAATASELFPFVLPWDDASPGVTNLSHLLEKPAGASGFVTARDGHLYVGAKRIRFFGVNMCYGGNFPKHDEAEKVAARLARFGINCVRFHHMDSAVAPSGLVQADRKTLDPENLDRLDYFIAQLAKNGIYANLNLHVGNNYPGTPKWEGATSYFKGVDNWYPPMLEAQRDYARALLKHVNKYTGRAYADEPAVAFIEINNENGLIMEWNNGALDHMPDPLASEFTKQWNAWLTRKYGTPEKLAAAWDQGSEPLGEEMLKNRTFSEGATAWDFQTLEAAKGKWTVVNLMTDKKGEPKVSLKMEVLTPGAQAWHVQLNQGNLKVEGGKSYTVELLAKASKARTVSLNLSQAHAPWKGLASVPLKLTTEWQKLQLPLSPTESDENARLSFSNLGGEVGEIHLAEVSLRRGGVSAFREGEKLGSIPFIRKSDLGRRTLLTQRDWNHFLVDTELAYWPGMSRFLKEELKAKSPVLGSAGGFSPWIAQAKLDVVDAHAYWQHPHFPRKQWDFNDWTVKNLPMAGHPEGGTLPSLALRRVAGKPFIVTEYNHSAPNQYSAEAFLEVCAMGALQDWDGIFAFAYAHRNKWDLQRFASFFDIDQHPTKLATLPAAISLFYRADLQPPGPLRVAQTTMEGALESIRKGSSWVDSRAYGITRDEVFQHPVGMALGPEVSKPAAPAPAGPVIRSDHGQLTWDTTARRMLVVTPRSCGVVGKLAAGETVELGEVKVTPGATNLGWATINLTAMDGPSLADATRILITATGETTNTDWQWKDEGKTTVGSNWGKSPSIVEGVPASISFRHSGKLKAWALDARGRRKSEVPLKTAPGTVQIELAPEHQTVWYELARD